MIGKITPLVKVAGNASWSSAVAFHLAGLTVSGATLGLLAGSLGSLAGLRGFDGLAYWPLLAVPLAFLDLGILRAKIPELVRQTPAGWQCVFGYNAGAFLWGLDLGQGWTVRIPFAAFYSLIAAAALGGSPFAGSAIMGMYAFGKGLPLLWARSRTGRVEQLMDACTDHRAAASRSLGLAACCAAGWVFAAFSGLT